VVRYHLELSSETNTVHWVVERRYTEFLQFRDRACEFLGVSRRCFPLPSRRPWRLSVNELEERRKGLQELMDTVRRVELLAESEVLREFVCRGADRVRVDV
jgi:hypothetical protein